jgi:hypothetical protein
MIIWDTVGLNVPVVDSDGFLPPVIAPWREVGGKRDCWPPVTASTVGGLAVHLALVAMGGELGLEVDLAKVPSAGIDRDDTLLFSESAGRFVVTVAPDNQDAFEAAFAGQPIANVGRVAEMRRN